MAELEIKREGCVLMTRTHWVKPELGPMIPPKHKVYKNDVLLYEGYKRVASRVFNKATRGDHNA